MKFFGKALAAVALSVCLLALSACAGSAGSPQTQSSESGVAEEQLPALLDDLMPRASDLIAAYSGGGLLADWNNSLPIQDNGQQFAPVINSDYKSAQDLRDATEKVFTPEYAQANFYEYAFSGDMPRYKDIDGALYIDGMQGGGGYSTFDVSTMKVTAKTADGFTVEMDYTTAYETKGSARITLKVSGSSVLIDGFEYLS